MDAKKQPSAPYNYDAPRERRLAPFAGRSVGYREIVWLEIQYGQYHAKCDLPTSFHSHPPGVDLNAKYDHKVRQAVLDHILQDKQNLSAVPTNKQRDTEALLRNRLLIVKKRSKFARLKNGRRER